MMRNVSRPVWRKEIGDVLLCSNAPISYPTSDGAQKKAKASGPGPFSSLPQFPLGALLLCPKEDLFPFWVRATRSLETQKPHLSLHHPLRLVADVRTVMRSPGLTPGFFAEQSPGWWPRQWSSN